MATNKKLGPDERPLVVGTYIIGTLALVFASHIMGRFGYRLGYFAFVVSDTITLFAILFLGIMTAVILTRAYHVKVITWVAMVGTALIVAGQAINVMDGVSAFGGEAPIHRTLVWLKEPVISLGIIFIFGSFYWCIFAVHRARIETQKEREDLAIEVEERRKANEALNRGRDELELRVAERTAELAKTNEQLRQTIEDSLETQHALAQSEVKYRELVQSANSMILQLDLAARIVFANDFAQRFFGYAANEMIGRPFLGTVLPETKEHAAVIGNLMRHIGDNPDDYINSENDCIRQNGETARITWTNRPLHTELGGFNGVLCIGNDITERIRAERTIADQQMTMMHAARMSSLGVMASGIAHEINNPLAIISAGAEQLDDLVASGGMSLERARETAQAIVRNVTRIQRIIRALRGLSRGGEEDQFRKTKVGLVVADALELCQERFKLHSVRLIVMNAAKDIEMDCRAAQLSQVLLNLLNNAYDAAEELPEKWVALEVLDEDDCVVFAITDSGTGLPAEVREKAFVPFFTTKKEGRGTGLGLSITRSIIESHHGEIRVDTTCPNTRFVARIPKYQDRVPRSRTAEPANQSL